VGHGRGGRSSLLGTDTGRISPEREVRAVCMCAGRPIIKTRGRKKVITDKVKIFASMYFKDRLYTRQNLLHKHVQCERCKNDTKDRLTAPLILINTGGRRNGVNGGGQP
jgi:hypothetical protein